MIKMEEKLEIWTRRTLPLPRPIKGRSLLEILSSSFKELNDDELTLEIEESALGREGNLVASTAYIKLKRTIDYPESLTPKQGLALVLSQLLEHPLLTELREEEYYFGVFVGIDLEETEREFVYIENRPYRRRYTEEFLPCFMRLYESLCKKMGGF